MQQHAGSFNTYAGREELRKLLQLADGPRSTAIDHKMVITGSARLQSEDSGTTTAL
jgi:hypothetical protein